jgi:hypothetical protein
MNAETFMKICSPFPLSLALLVACTGDDLPADPPDYGTDDSGTSGIQQYLAGPDPYEEGELRAGVGDVYEGPSSATFVIDDVDVFFYVYEDTFAAIQHFEDPIEGLYAWEWVSKGRGWWGGGIHHTTGVMELTPYATLHIGLKSSSAEMSDVVLGMITQDASSDATLVLADYGWLPDGEWHALEIPLADFVDAGADLDVITSPFFLIGENSITEGESILIDDLYVTSHEGSTHQDPGDGDGDGDGGGTGQVTPLLENGGFETYTESADGVIRPDAWAVYPPELTNFGTAMTGDALGEGASSSFEAAEGSAGLWVTGTAGGAESETAIYQTFDPVIGATYTLSGSAMMPSSQAISDDSSYALLQIKMFNSSWGMVDSFESAWIDISSSPDTWTSLEVSGVASSSVAYVQAAVEFWECVDQSKGCAPSEGVIYFDDLSFEQAE